MPCVFIKSQFLLLKIKISYGFCVEKINKRIIEFFLNVVM